MMNEKQCLRLFGGWLRGIRRVNFLVLAVVLASSASLTGCADTGENPESNFQNKSTNSRAAPRGSDTDWLKAFDSGNVSAEGSAAVAAGGGRWTIALATFGADAHRASAEEFRRNLARTTGLNGFVVTSRADRSIVHFGRYAEPSTERIRADLALIQAIEIDGRQPFARAFPTVVAPSDIGEHPQFNLVQLWSQYPRAAVIYSLQIAFFSFDDAKSSAEARQTAESTVARLRAEGEAAFYYHGPRMSMVTVGVFFEQDVDVVTGVSRAVRELQLRYPSNLDNGREIIETKRLPSGKVERRVQPSFLINVPKQ